MSNRGFKDEPVMWMAVVTALLGVAVAWGASLTTGQQMALEALAAAVIPLVLGYVARQQVTPVAKLPEVKLG